MSAPETVFEWIGGPRDGAVVTIAGVIHHLELMPRPPAGPYTGDSVEDVFAQAFPEPVIVELEQRPDGRLVARWPYQALGR